MRVIVGLLVGLLVIAPCVAFAAGALDERVTALEERLSDSFLGQVDISGVVEVEAGYSSDYDDVKEGDVDLTNLELGLDIAPVDYLTGFILLKWEEDGGEGVFVDEGGITLGNLEEGGLALTAGKLYVPFGVYETGLISDPLTLELGETREGAVAVDFSSGGFYASLYVFNSAVNDDDEDDTIDAFGASAGYALEAESMGADFSIGYISNMTSSGGFSDALDEAGVDVLDEYTAGMTASAVVSAGAFTLIGEYLTALDNDYLVGQDEEPAAWNLELGYGFDLSGHAASLSVAYQGTDEAAFLGLPETRLAAAFGYEIIEGVGVAFEVAHDEDYDLADGGTDESADTVTCQLALEF